MDGDDLRRLRIQRDALRTPAPALASGGAPAFVGKVTTASPQVGKFFLANPVAVSGSEAEGGAGTFTPTDPNARVPVLALGPTAPSSGDYVIPRFVDYRWVAERTKGGGGGGSVGMIPNCFCDPIPAVVAMTSADPACNYRMFQSCSISYGPHPGFESLNFGLNYYLSDQGFPDPVANGAIFYYALLCQYNQFSLTRAYLESPYGSPFRDGILYTWLVGGYGNTCDPFHLDNGTAFPGSDPSCNVKIDG